MGLFSDIRAARAVQKIKKGRTEKLWVRGAPQLRDINVNAIAEMKRQLTELEKEQ